MPLPTEAEEANDPQAADVVYNEAIAALRELTRDPARFPLVLHENAEYGFRRNCLGLRWIGFTIAATAAGLAAGVLLVESHYDGSHLLRWLVPGSLGILCGLFWLVMVRPRWVRNAAEIYAERLFEAVASLRTSTS